MKKIKNIIIKVDKFINEKCYSPHRWKILVKYLTPYLINSKTVLDVGAGDGGLASQLLKTLSLKITGVDVYLQAKTFIPIIKYDGQTLPFPDKSFDTVMINDVLHHDMHLDRILSESKRVTKKYILIKDHYWNNYFDFLLLKWADFFGNLSYGVNLPYNYQSLSGWQKHFKSLGLKIIAQENFRYGLFDPCRQVIFLLKKTKSATII